ncbi:hypothetical protein CYLTODRAFT_365144 [Cylindrobasidium torrendii FP15055 ss-10]|uniref:F-box domain-containing protein n=1 Tax=Cylindrobasidium torrendii FP15055 ss-10 TaxID=1314674 RepID=A0A0D7BVJ9_9AGAR|nr:hypothetical protein CYLTODRAFT_365144 [Cylindrobasidium torrendii FP15055 ss-10]
MDHYNKEEELEVKRMITAHETAIQAVDEEIVGLEQQIRRLLFTKSQHVGEIRLLKGRITLARRLPPDILANIFERCARDGFTLTPLVASHVCSEWREAALIPHVWSHLYVNTDTAEPLGRVEFWLNRVKAAPLFVHMEIKNDLTHIRPITDALVSRSSQWHTLTISSTLLQPVNDAIGRCKGQFTNLRRMSISIKEESSVLPEVETRIIGLPGAFQNAPSLRLLRLSRSRLPDRGSIPSTIRELELDLDNSTVQISALLDVLEGLPLLESLSLSTPTDHSTSAVITAATDPLVTLPALTSLTMVTDPLAFQLLRSLHLPALRHIALRNSRDPLAYPHQVLGASLLHLLQSDDLPVERMELQDLDLSHEDFLTAARYMPRLQELSLHESDIPDEVLLSISGLCPSLQQLDLRWCGQITGRALVRLARDRLDASETSPPVVQPLRSVTVINCSHVQEVDILDLAQATVCRLVLNDMDDYCSRMGCCSNDRYRRRFYRKLLERGQGHVSRNIVI